jgi:hypothetical protein
LHLKWNYKVTGWHRHLTPSYGPAAVCPPNPAHPNPKHAQDLGHDFSAIFSSWIALVIPSLIGKIKSYWESGPLGAPIGTILAAAL